jgi:DNA-binding transcriptional MerR regulator
MENDYITIGDLADATGFTRQGLYNYEKMGLLTPDIVAGDKEKTRLYRRDKIDLVKHILELKNTYHLKAIKEILDKQQSDSKGEA